MAMTSILVTLARMASVRMVGKDGGMHFTGCPVPLITETCLKVAVLHYGLDIPGSICLPTAIVSDHRCDSVLGPGLDGQWGC